MNLSEIILYTLTGVAFLSIIFISVSFIAYKVKNRDKVKPYMHNPTPLNNNYRRTSEILTQEHRIDNHMVSLNYYVDENDRITNPTNKLHRNETQRMFR
ncbi:MAG TPA: hypothetical protein VMV32_02510 [Ignavibacteriaceae bacterium]|nr:hypothetical protein [Ignavibacteriaceae bacterium]